MMKIKLSVRLILLFMFAFTSFCQIKASELIKNQMQELTLNINFPKVLHYENNTAIIPFQLVDHLIIVQATVGTESGNFIFDTGSKKLVLNSKYFHLQPRYVPLVVSGVTGDIRNVNRKKIDTLLLGNLILNKLDACMIDLGHLEHKKGIKLIGLLGFEVFKDYEIFLDFQLSRIALTKLDIDGNRLGINEIEEIMYDSVAFSLFGHSIVLEVGVNGETLKFALDSGAEINLLDSDVHKKVLENFSILGTVTLSGVGNIKFEAIKGVLKDVQIGNRTSVGMKTILTNAWDIQSTFGFGVDGILGYSFLFNKRTLINYKKRMLYFIYPRPYEPDSDKKLSNTMARGGA